MTPTEPDQYRALRATIRQRGTARIWIFVVGVAAWGALAVATATLATQPIATLLPLLVLAAAFEGVYALHVGVERIGRYLAVFFDDGWERAAAAFGRPAGAARADPIFALVFGVATLVNLAPALVAQPTTAEVAFIGGAHALFGVRLAFARLTASKQRAIDHERFLAMKREFSHEDTKTRSY